MAHKMQANPGEITWHEGAIPMTDNNTPNAESSQEDEHPLVTGINLMAKVGVQIGKAADEIKRAGDRMDQLARAVERNTPVDASGVASGQYVTGTPLVLNFGQPDVGTFWELTSFAVGGLEVNVSATGSWGLYTSALPTLAGAGLANLVDVGASMPAVFNYGTAQLIANDGENVFAIIFGGTNGQTYVANIQYRVFNIIASQGQVTYGI